MSRIQSHALGTQTRQLTNKIDPENNYYPVPLFCGQFTTVSGNETLIFPMYYCQVPRFKEVLTDFISKGVDLTTVTTYYQQNLLHLACSPNHPSNLMYHDNHTYYDYIFWFIIKTVGPEQLKTLFNKADIFGRTPIADTVYNRHVHYFFALLNYGFKLTDKDFEKEHILSLDANPKYTDNTIVPFIKSDKLKIVQDSNLNPGQKLLSLASECPITLEKITHPIICEDGMIYEYSAFKKHVATNGLKSPITNKKLFNPYIYHILEDRFESLYE